MRFIKDLTKDEIANIIRLYEEGHSGKDIAKEYKFGKNTILALLKRENIPINKFRSQSKKAKGRPSSRRGAKLSAETIAKMVKNRPPGTGCWGRVISEETKKRISEGIRKFWKEHPERKVGRPIGMETLEEQEVKKIKERLRGRTKNLLRRLTRLNCYIKRGKTNFILGYNWLEYKTHIELQFKDGMSWSGKESFHVDHIVPIDAFVQKGIYEPHIINALINLQPLYPHENRSKNNNYNMANFNQDLEKINQYLQTRGTRMSF